MTKKFHLLLIEAAIPKKLNRHCINAVDTKKEKRKRIFFPICAIVFEAPSSSPWLVYCSFSFSFFSHTAHTFFCVCFNLDSLCCVAPWKKVLIINFFLSLHTLLSIIICSTIIDDDDDDGEEKKCRFRHNTSHPSPLSSNWPEFWLNLILIFLLL